MVTERNTQEHIPDPKDRYDTRGNEEKASVNEWGWTNGEVETWYVMQKSKARAGGD